MMVSHAPVNSAGRQSFSAGRQLDSQVRVKTYRIMLSITQEPPLLRKLNTIEI
jgi:hypothetical protein